MSAVIKIKNFRQRNNLQESVVFIFYKFLQKTFNLDRQEIVLLELANLSDDRCVLPEGYTGGFADYETLRAQAAEDPALDMNEEFLNEAIGKQDLCYAISTEGKIVSYGWYSQKPTKMQDDVYFYFNNQYVYMYKGVTKPEYRGKRLHAIGMASAMKSPQLISSKGMVSCVERQNLASLRSVYRMGYRRIGSIYMLNFLGRHYNFSTPGCEKTHALTKRRSSCSTMEGVQAQA
jgi:hypothetical protein